MRFREKLILGLVFLAAAAVGVFTVLREIRLQELERLNLAAQKQLSAATLPMPMTPKSVEQIRAELVSRSLSSLRTTILQQSNCSSRCDLVNTVVWEGNVRRGESMITVLIVRTASQSNLCPDCGAELSLFEFQDEIALLWERLAFSKLASSGAQVKTQFEVHAFDNESYVIASTSTAQSGDTETTRLVMHRATSAGTEWILDMTTGERNGSRDAPLDAQRLDWRSTWKFEHIAGGVPELVFEQLGISYGKLVHKVVRYRMVDGRYAEVAAPPNQPGLPEPENPTHGGQRI